MPKSKIEKKGAGLRHQSLGKDIVDTKEKASGKLKAPSFKKSDADSDEEEDMDELDAVPDVGVKTAAILNQAREMREEDIASARAGAVSFQLPNTGEDDEYEDDVDEEEDYEEDLVEYTEGDGGDGENYVTGAGLSESEEAVVQRFLKAGQAESRTLADIIIDKIKDKREDVNFQPGAGFDAQDSSLPPKVVEVYEAVGAMLAHYKAGKVPKALKMLPQLKNWEEVLWLTRPDSWSSSATFVCTRIFASNFNEKLAQRFYNMVLLEKCRDDIRNNNKLNYHLYMSLKKAMFKPGAFYKGIILPLAQSGTCTLREATIIGSVLAKVSIPSNHSAAALLRLAEMSYSGSTSLFIKILVNKKYSLPKRVIASMVDHFTNFVSETRVLPVIWHQSLLAFAQRYKLELEESQKEQFKELLKVHSHHQITMEVRRELFSYSRPVQAI